MNHKNQRLLNEAYLEVRNNEAAKRHEAAHWNEVKAFGAAMVNEGYDLSDMTWGELSEAYLREFGSRGQKTERQKEIDRNSDGQDKGLTKKVADTIGNFFNPPRSQSKDAVVRNGGSYTGRGGSPVIPSGMSASEQARLKREADRQRRAGKMADLRGNSSNPDPAVKPSNNNSNNNSNNSSNNNNSSSNNNSSNNNSNNNSSNNNSSTTQRTSQRPAPAKQTGDKAKDMASWAKANPELAKRQQQRQANRGTSSSSNPLMKDLKRRMPQSSATKPSPTPARADSSQMRAMSQSSSQSSSQKPKATPIKSGRLRDALNSVGKTRTNESADVFDVRFNELRQKGFSQDEVYTLMFNEGMARYEEKKEAANNKKRKLRINICPSLDEAVLDYYFNEWITDNLNEGADLSSYYELDLWENFLKQVASDPEIVMELRRSEKEGKGSPETRSDMSPTGYLMGARGQKKSRGEKGGRHPLSGGGVGSESSRGKKKGEPGSEYDRMNPKEKEGRQLERGTKAATRRAYGYGSGRYQGD